MKLEDWWDKNIRAPFPVDFIKEGGEGLQVIGTCGDCKYFSFDAGHCVHAKMSCFIPYGTFGCIHFEEKGEK